MHSYSKTKRFAAVIFPVLIISALLLTACGGQRVSAAAEADTSAQVEAGGQSGAAEADSGNPDDLYASGEAEQNAETGASDEGAAAESAIALEAATAADAEPEAYPELVLGDPAFHVTDPSTVSLASGEVQFVEFFAYWCTVCKAIAPTVHGLEQIYGDRVNFVYLDRDDPATANLQAQLGYVYQPHIFILDAQGNVLFESLSYVEGSVLQEAIEQALQ